MMHVQIPALDGVPLRATLYEPRHPTAAVIVNSATAVPRGFYRAFAAYLEAAGAAVLTYDYRGSGDAPAALRASNARMRDWGTLDFAGAIAWMRARYPLLPLHAVGHSVGGHVLFEAPNNGELTGAVAVATQSGYWRHYRGIERYRIWIFMQIFMPLLARLFGYFPSRLVGFGDDLATGVMNEFRYWCRLPNYFFDDPSMREVLAHVQTLHAETLLVGVMDDPWATSRAIDALLPAFARARLSRIEVCPSALGLGRVGHLGFFRAQNGDRLWPIITKHLRLRANEPIPGAIPETFSPA